MVRPWWPGLAVVALGLTALVSAGIVAAGIQPVFYRERLAPAVTEADKQSARRLVTKVAGLQAAFEREGVWETVLTEHEINAWLSVDLPRNHVALLPAGWSGPRVALEPGRIRAGARRALGPLGAVMSLAIDVRLRQRNVVECTVADARLGAIPLPRATWLHWLARRFAPLGLPTEIRRRHGESTLSVTLPATGRHRVAVDSLAVESEELLMAGTVTKSTADAKAAHAMTADWNGATAEPP